MTNSAKLLEMGMGIGCSLLSNWFLIVLGVWDGLFFNLRWNLVGPGWTNWALGGKIFFIYFNGNHVFLLFVVSEGSKHHGNIPDLAIFVYVDTRRRRELRL